MQALPESSKGKVSVLGTAILDIGLLASSGNSSNYATTLPVICKSGDSDVEAAFGVLFSSFRLYFCVNLVCLITISNLLLYCYT